jgi:hypothetical protein
MKRDRLTSILVVCFGLYQLGHMSSNFLAAYLYASRGVIGFPALPPPGGWSPDMVNVYIDMASMDTLNAIASLVFVWAYFKAKPWHLWLGTVTLTLSFYAGILFNLTAFQAGAWVGANLWLYLFINITYIPIAVLWGQVMYWGYKNRS